MYRKKPEENERHEEMSVQIRKSDFFDNVCNFNDQFFSITFYVFFNESIIAAVTHK